MKQLNEEHKRLNLAKMNLVQLHNISALDMKYLLNTRWNIKSLSDTGIVHTALRYYTTKEFEHFREPDSATIYLSNIQYNIKAINDRTKKTLLVKVSYRHHIKSGIAIALIFHSNRNWVNYL